MNSIAPDSELEAAFLTPGERAYVHLPEQAMKLTNNDLTELEINVMAITSAVRMLQGSVDQATALLDEESLAAYHSMNAKFQALLAEHGLAAEVKLQ